MKDTNNRCALWLISWIISKLFTVSEQLVIHRCHRSASPHSVRRCLLRDRRHKLIKVLLWHCHFLTKTGSSWFLQLSLIAKHTTSKMTPVFGMPGCCCSSSKVEATGRIPQSVRAHIELCVLSLRLDFAFIISHAWIMMDDWMMSDERQSDKRVRERASFNFSYRSST